MLHPLIYHLQLRLPFASDLDNVRIHSHSFTNENKFPSSDFFAVVPIFLFEMNIVSQLIPRTRNYILTTLSRLTSLPNSPVAPKSAP